MCTNLQLKKLTSDMVQEYRRVYGKDIETILLFGSYARGDQENDSDVRYRCNCSWRTYGFAGTLERNLGCFSGYWIGK